MIIFRTSVEIKLRTYPVKLKTNSLNRNGFVAQESRRLDLNKACAELLASSDHCLCSCSSLSNTSKDIERRLAVLYSTPNDLKGSSQ